MTRGLMDTVDPVFADEVCRFQRLYPSKTVSEIAEHFGCDSSLGVQLIQRILSAPDMRRYRRGIGSVEEGSAHKIKRGQWA